MNTKGVKMAPKKYKKVSLRLDAAIADELDSYAALAGTTRSGFMQMALVIGMRALGRNFAPEKFMTPELLKAMREAGYDVPNADGAEVSK